MNKPTPKRELLKTSLWLAFKVMSTRRVSYTRCPKCHGLLRPMHGYSNPGPCPYCGNDKLSEEHENSHLALKFIGVGFIICIIGTVVLAALSIDYQACSHLACVCGGYLAASLGLTVKPAAL